MVYLSGPLLIFALTILTKATYPSKKTLTIPSSPAKGESHVDFSFHSNDNLLAPKISPINSTVWEWWYFSTLSTSPSSLASLSIGFYTATQLAFPVNITTSSNVLFTSLSGTFENGTRFGAADIPVRAVLREDGLVGLWDMGDTGDWDEYKMWVGSEDLKKWWVKWDKDIASGVNGVEGRMVFEANVGARLGCGGEVLEGGNMQVMPGIGWNMAVTDADVWVDVRVGQERVRFEGMGFVEKTWGARTFEEVGMPGVVWGYGRLGPYTVIWWSGTSQLDGERYSSSYLYDSVSQSVVTASCSSDAVVVKPLPNELVDASERSKRARGCVITLPNAFEGMAFEMVVTLRNADAAPSFGARWTARIEGGWLDEGQQLYDGIGVVDGPGYIG